METMESHLEVIQSISDCGNRNCKNKSVMLVWDCIALAKT